MPGYKKLIKGATKKAFSNLEQMFEQTWADDDTLNKDDYGEDDENDYEEDIDEYFD